MTLTSPLVKIPVLSSAATATVRIVRVDITSSPNLFRETKVHRPSPPTRIA